MRAALRDLPLLQHNDLVGMLNGAEPVGDDQGSAVLQQAIKRRLNELL